MPETLYGIYRMRVDAADFQTKRLLYQTRLKKKIENPHDIWKFTGGTVLLSVDKRWSTESSIWASSSLIKNSRHPNLHTNILWNYCIIRYAYGFTQSYTGYRVRLLLILNHIIFNISFVLHMFRGSFRIFLPKWSKTTSLINSLHVSAAQHFNMLWPIDHGIFAWKWIVASGTQSEFK